MPCEKLFYTVRIHPDLAQDIPALDIRSFPDGFEPPSPNVFGNAGVIDWTPAQMPLVGASKLDRLEWAIACKLTEEESLQLAALYAWQQRRLLANQDARLRWIDRFEPTEPEPLANLNRDIIDAKTTTYGYTYGFPVVDCLLSRPSRQLLSSRGSTPVRLCAFTVTEVRDGNP